MNPHNIDWQYLGHGLTRSVAVLVLCAGVWGATTFYHARVSATLESGRQELASLQHERNEITSRRAARQQFATVYTDLEAKGIVGEDQRLLWVQNARDARHSLGLPYLRYATGPQQVFEAPWLVPGLTAPVAVSVMELQLGLVHEGDLVRLVSRLRQSPGLLQVKSCAMERLGADAAPAADKANLTGTCQLAWYSLPRTPIQLAANAESEA